MASPIRVHRPKCAFAGRPFTQTPPNYDPYYGNACTCFEFPSGYVPPLLPNVDLTKGVLVCKVEWRVHNKGCADETADWYIFAWTTAPDKQWYGGTKVDDKHRFYIANNASQVRKWVVDHPTDFPDPRAPKTYHQALTCAMEAKLDQTIAGFLLGDNNERHPAQLYLQQFDTPDSLIGQSITINTTRICRCGSTEHWTSQHPTQEEAMPTLPARPTAASKAEAIRRQVTELLAEADRLDSFPQEPQGPVYRKQRKRNGRIVVPEVRADLIWWVMRFDSRTDEPREYFYAAVRTNDGLWSTTGPQSPKNYTWDQLITWIHDNMENPEIFVVTAMDKI